ncbi:MAG: tetratricopeptide repeat protein, partial [Deltaproteobacteria bacterium]|nr:tetratricopeptide repeat protein [Deltaproteobacteria bacterium]
RWVLYRALRKGVRPGFDPEDRSLYAPQDPDTARIAEEFRQNYREIVALCRSSGTPLMLVASPINLTFRGQDPRVHGRVAAMPADDPALRRGGELFLEARYEEALEEYAKSPQQGWAAKRMADCLVRLGRFGEARDLYKVYVEELPMNRTRPSFNRFLRELARDDGVLLADLEKKAEDISPNGITSPKLYVDYCHMTWLGYYAMAQEVIRELAESGLISAKDGEPHPAPSLDELIESSGAQELYSDPKCLWAPGKALYGLEDD